MYQKINKYMYIYIYRRYFNAYTGPHIQTDSNKKNTGILRKSHVLLPYFVYGARPVPYYQNSETICDRHCNFDSRCIVSLFFLFIYIKIYIYILLHHKNMCVVVVVEWKQMTPPEVVVSVWSVPGT